ncbi:MAG: Crp/Fnr family transcriptional regulator [Bacilli bacterium]|nr:Crp/Fnr family transcriptional regulator [Bacilli bacterium]
MTNLFANLSDKEIKKLMQVLRSNTITYRKNINILSNRTKDDYIAIIDSGSIQLVFNDYNGNKTIIEELNAGEIFGSLTYSLNSDEITCITKEETQITYIEYNQITNGEIIKNDFYIIFVKNLIKLLSDQLNRCNQRIELLTMRTTRDKLLGYFNHQAQIKGSKTFIMNITFTELASYLSVDRSSMTREISYLKEEGFIKINNKKITLLY